MAEKRTEKENMAARIKRYDSMAKSYEQKAKREYAYYKNGMKYDTSDEDRVKHYLASQQAYKDAESYREAAKKLKEQYFLLYSVLL